jgi:hypothetical protein
MLAFRLQLAFNSSHATVVDAEAGSYCVGPLFETVPCVEAWLLHVEKLLPVARQRFDRTGVVVRRGEWRSVLRELVDGGATKFHLHAYPALGSPLFSFSFNDDEVFDVAFDNEQEWVSFAKLHKPDGGPFVLRLGLCMRSAYHLLLAGRGHHWSSTQTRSRYRTTKNG